jgi:hypothetical protein
MMNIALSSTSEQVHTPVSTGQQQIHHQKKINHHHPVTTIEKTTVFPTHPDHHHQQDQQQAPSQIRYQSSFPKDYQESESIASNVAPKMLGSMIQGTTTAIVLSRSEELPPSSLMKGRGIDLQPLEDDDCPFPTTHLPAEKHQLHPVIIARVRSEDDDYDNDDDNNNNNNNAEDEHEVNHREIITSKAFLIATNTGYPLATSSSSSSKVPVNKVTPDVEILNRKFDEDEYDQTKEITTVDASSMMIGDVLFAHSSQELLAEMNDTNCNNHIIEYSEDSGILFEQLGMDLDMIKDNEKLFNIQKKQDQEKTIMRSKRKRAENHELQKKMNIESNPNILVSTTINKQLNTTDQPVRRSGRRITAKKVTF